MNDKEFDLVWDYSRICECNAKILWATSDFAVQRHLETALKFVNDVEQRKELLHMIEYGDKLSVTEIEYRVDKIKGRMFDKLLRLTYY